MYNWQTYNYQHVCKVKHVGSSVSQYWVVGAGAVLLDSKNVKHAVVKGPTALANTRLTAFQSMTYDATCSLQLITILDISTYLSSLFSVGIA